MTSKTCSLFAVLGSALVANFAFADGAVESEPVLLYAHPEKSFLWRIAPEREFLLRWDAPSARASSATLTVSGVRYERTYPGLDASGSLTLELPSASKRSDENLYELTLAFDSGEVKQARLAVVAWMEGGGIGGTKCLSKKSGKWTTFRERALVPIPYGATSLTVNGEALAFDGSADWYMLGPARDGIAFDLSLSGGEYAGDASLVSQGEPILIIIR